MKNLAKALFAVLFLAFASCSEDESLIEPNETASTPEEAIATAMEVTTPETPLPFMMQYNPVKDGGNSNAKT